VKTNHNVILRETLLLVRHNYWYHAIKQLTYQVQHGPSIQFCFAKSLRLSD